MTRQEFIDLLMPHALEASRRTGVDPRIIIAQAAQETGWGAHAPGNNYFGIKSHGQSGGNSLGTTEYVGGQPVRITDSFRSYGSPAESVNDYATFLLTNSRYREMMAAQGLDAQLAALGRSGYATDPNYASSVGAIARGIVIPGDAQPMAYTGGQNTSAGQAAIAANTGPGQDVTSPPPAPGSQRLFMPRSEAAAAREAGGTPRLDELSNIIRQRRMGNTPLLDRLQNFIQERRDARQANQTPTPPAPIPTTGNRSGGGGGGGGGGPGDPQVLALQQELAAAGFDPGPLDGIMGPRTRAAMAARDAAQAPGVPMPNANPLRGTPPMPNANPLRGGGPGPSSGFGNYNPGAPMDYRPSIPMQPTQPITAPRPGQFTQGSLTPEGSSGFGNMNPMALLNFGAGIQPRNPSPVPTPSVTPSLGPLLAGYTPGNGAGVPTTPVSRGVLPDIPMPQVASAPTQGPGAGGRPVTTTVGQVAPDQQWGIDNGLMPAFRNDFGPMDRLPTFNEQNPYITRQGQGFRPEVQTTSPPGSSMLPLRASWPIPPWWRQLMGAGV